MSTTNTGGTVEGNEDTGGAIEKYSIKDMIIIVYGQFCICFTSLEKHQTEKLYLNHKRQMYQGEKRI